MRWRLRVLSLVLLSCVSGQAQRVSFGVKGGLTGMNGFSGSYYTRSEARAHTFGPMVEFKLPASLAIEFDVLYRRTGYTKGGESFGLNTITQMRANTWDFPLLLKYYGSRGRVRPYAAGWVGF